MVDLRRTCPACKRQYRPRKGTRRRFCETCRPSRVRAVVEAPPVLNPGPGECEIAVRAQLDAAGRGVSVPGVLACRLARQLDDASLTGAQAASLARQVQDLMAAALVGAAPVRDFVDEMAQRRARSAGA